MAILEGVSPLLINRFKENDEQPDKMRKAGKRDYGSPREQAEATAYHDDGKCWIPSTWVKGSLSAISSDYKLPSSRKSVKSVIGGAVIPVEEKLFFREGWLLTQIEVDSRPCVVQRARIMRHRARFERWSISVGLELETDILTEDNVHAMLVDAGRRAGLGDFRPQRGGPYGRFRLVSWKPLTETD